MGGGGTCIIGVKQFRYLRYAIAMRFMDAIRSAIVCTAALYFRLFRCVPSSGQSVYIPVKPYIAIYHKAEKKIVLLAIILLNCHYNMFIILYTEQYN